MAPVTNAVTRLLFMKYRGPEDFAQADQAVLAEEIRPVGLSQRKARYVIETCRMLLERHQGQVPRSMADLTDLPGVSRRTANMVRMLAYGQPGIIVDGHVNRVSNRTGVVSSKTPYVIERKLQELLPVEYWTRWCFVTIAHGRRICVQRNPHCGVCPILHLCPFGQLLLRDSSKG